MNCSFKSCPHPLLGENDDRVHVRFDFDHDDDERLTATLINHVGSKGDAKFHQTCWESLLQSSENKRLLALMQQAEETAEYFQSRAKLDQQADRAVQLLQQANHAVVFTGAGISTSAGIGDFRGLFGQWTEDDRKSASKADEDGQSDYNMPYEDLRPTLAHEALVWLVEQDTLKYIITQNCDGLHTLSGVSSSKLSELHGNVFKEYCKNGCGREFIRNYDVEEEVLDANTPKSRKKRRVEKCKRCKLSHQTVRSCPDCHKPLFDTIINFGDWLPDSELKPAEKHGALADVMLILGSTVTVSPASNLCNPRKQKLIICNRQETALDGKATARAFGDCDIFMKLILERMMGDDYQQWEQARSTRMAEYDKRRKSD